MSETQVSKEFQAFTICISAAPRPMIRVRSQSHPGSYLAPCF